MGYESAKKSKSLPKHILKDGAKWLMLPSKVISNSLTLWPESQNFATTLSHFFFLFSYLFFIFGNIYFMFWEEADLASVTATLTLINIGIESAVRLVLVRYNMKRLKILLHKIYYEFWPSNIAGEETHMQLKRESWYLVIFFTFYTSAALINVMQFAIVPLYTENMPLGTSYPFPWRKSPCYEILYIWEAFIVIVMPFAVCGYDMFIISIWFNCIAQFKLLRAYLKNEFQEALLKKNYNVEVKKLLRLCIIQHNKMIGYSEDDRPKLTETSIENFIVLMVCKEIDGTFTYFILLQVLISIGAVCLSSFVGTVLPEKIGTALPYLMGHTSLIFIYSFMGNELIIESKELSDAAYECGWNLVATDKDIKKSLILIMLRSQRPLTISTGGFGFLSLHSFMKLLQFSFSVYTLLNTMMKKQNMSK